MKGLGLKGNLGNTDIPLPKKKITPKQKQSLLERLNLAVEAKRAKQQERLDKSMWGQLNPAEKARVRKMFNKFRAELLEARDDMHALGTNSLSDDDINKAAKMMVEERIPELFGIRHDGTRKGETRTNEGKPKPPERDTGPEEQAVNPFGEGAPISTEGI